MTTRGSGVPVMVGQEHKGVQGAKVTRYQGGLLRCPASWVELLMESLRSRRVHGGAVQFNVDSTELV